MAFSRDQAHKIYVQDKMRERRRPPDIWAWLQEGAHFYVCGDGARMAKDVDTELHRIAGTEGGKSPEEAAAYVESLKKEKRYKKDVNAIEPTVNRRCFASSMIGTLAWSGCRRRFQGIDPHWQLIDIRQARKDGIQPFWMVAAGKWQQGSILHFRLGSPLAGHFDLHPFMSSQFGHAFRISTWGESHGGGVGVVIDGCPPRLALSEADIQRDLDRRRPGQSEIVTPRDEADQCRILSGVFEGQTLGTPICIAVMNKDARPEAYREMETAFRPSHADYTYQAKYGIRNWQGGGRASARETIGRVAAAAVAKKALAQIAPGLEIVAYVKTIHELTAEVNPETVTFEQVEANIVRCPDAAKAQEMIEFIKQVRGEGDSVGGTVECVIRGTPAGWGEPVFDKLEAELA